MNLAEFDDRLANPFGIDRFEERGGWEFALTRAETADLLRVASSRFAAGFNGLLCAPAPEQHDVTRVYLLVFPEESLVEQVIAEERRRGKPGAAIVTHHPCDMETSNRGFIAIPSAQLDPLLDCRTTPRHDMLGLPRTW